MKKQTGVSPIPKETYFTIHYSSSGFGSAKSGKLRHLWWWIGYHGLYQIDWWLQRKLDLKKSLIYILLERLNNE